MKFYFLFFLISTFQICIYGQKPEKYIPINASKVNYLITVLSSGDSAKIEKTIFMSFNDLNIALYEPLGQPYPVTLLGTVISQCDTSILIKLLSKGANPNLVISNVHGGITDVSERIFLTAVSDTAKMNILLRFGANINQPEIKNTILDLASRTKDAKLRQYYLRLYGSSVPKDAIYNMVLSSPRKLTLDALFDLVQNGASLQERGLLVCAMEKGVSDDVILEMIRLNADVNLARSESVLSKPEYPIFAAIYFNKYIIVKALVERGANLNSKGYYITHPYTNDPLGYAMDLKRMEIADFLFPLTANSN